MSGFGAVDDFISRLIDHYLIPWCSDWRIAVLEAKIEVKESLLELGKSYHDFFMKTSKEYRDDHTGT